MKIAIIGAGWYGCHIASKLMEEDFHVTVFEKETAIFQHASGKNQNRLHVGFHYARDSITRKQTEIGYAKFIQEYGYLTKNVENNLYLIPENNSLFFITLARANAHEGSITIFILSQTNLVVSIISCSLAKTISSTFS